MPAAPSLCGVQACQVAHETPDARRAGMLDPPKGICDLRGAYGAAPERPQ